MPSTFETLSDELLITIFKYSGDAYTIFRTFLGLNQRLNSILVSRQLHLLSKFLHADEHDDSFNDYHVARQLLHMSSPIDEQQFRQCFQSLVTLHIKEQFKYLGVQVQSKSIIFETMRLQLSSLELIDLDKQLKKEFSTLQDNVITIKSLKQIEFLVRARTARLQCNDHYANVFNFAQALNRLLLCHLNNVHAVKRPFIQPITKMFEALIVCNTSLLRNRDRTEYDDSCSAWFFLFYSVYQLMYWHYTPPEIHMNMQCYAAVVHLLLFAIQCRKKTHDDDEHWAQQSLFEVLKMICTDKVTNQNELFIQSVQWAILNIIIDEYELKGQVSWSEDHDTEFRSILGCLFKRNRLDVIMLVYRRLQPVQFYFDKTENIPMNINLMLGIPTGRQLLKLFFEEKPLKSWLISKDLLFLLLQKKERQLLKLILRSSSSLIDQVDESGNDPLLYICLEVLGCRHRIIELFITVGCNLQRRNLHGHDFLDAIQL